MFKKLFIILALILQGCAAFNYIVPAYTNLNFSVSDEVNPDPSGRASPIVVKIYELSSRTQFDNKDFFALYESPEKTLGPDLIVRDEYSFQPGAESSYEVSMQPGTRFVGLIAAYRDIDNAQWREVVEVEKTSYSNINVRLDALRLTVER